LKTTSNRETARATGIPRRSVDYTVNKIIKKAEEAGHTDIVAENPRVLFLDIETAPMLNYLWSLWPRGGINPDMQIERTYMLGWCAKWLGEHVVMKGSLRHFGKLDYPPIESEMLHDLWHLLDAADFVVAHNGDRFDIKRVNTEFLLAGLKPPSPYKQIDTLKMVKRTFGFDSNRLNYLCKTMFDEEKAQHDGFKTWVGCMNGDQKAWDDMMYYNAKDVLLLEKLYLTIRSWDKGHPNMLLGSSTEVPQVPACTTCGSLDVFPTGKTTQTNAGKYEGWECGDCGAQMRGRRNIVPLERRRVLLTRAK
jgi:hypothetical protein